MPTDPSPESLDRLDQWKTGGACQPEPKPQPESLVDARCPNCVAECEAVALSSKGNHAYASTCENCGTTFEFTPEDGEEERDGCNYA